MHPDNPLARNEEYGVQKHFRWREQWTIHCITIDTFYVCPN